MAKQTQFFFRKFNNITDRLDENYNDPIYDEIDTLLAKSKYEIISVGDSRILTNITKGKTPKGLLYVDEGIPFLRAENIIDEKVHIDSAQRIDKKFHTSSQLTKSQLKQGNVLVTMAGKIGECAVYDYDEECNCNQAIAILTIDQDAISPKYLVKCLNSRLGQLQFGKLQKTVDQPNIGFEEIKSIQIPYPNTPKEQDNILKSLVTFENQIDVTKKSIQTFEEKGNNRILEEIDFTITIDALEYFFKNGKQATSECFVITPNRINDRMHFHHFQPKLDLIYKFKKQYSTITLNSIVKEPIIRGEQPQYAEDGIIVIKTVDLKNRCIDYKSCLKTSKEFFDTVPNAHLKKSDILISSTGYVSIGKVDVYDRDESAMVDGHVSIVRIIDGYDPYFIAYFLRSHLGMIQFEKWWTGSSGQIEVQPTDLGTFVIPDNTEKGIPLRRQIEIANKVTKELIGISKLEEQKNELLKKAKLKFEQLLGLAQ